MGDSCGGFQKLIDNGYLNRVKQEVEARGILSDTLTQKSDAEATGGNF